MIFMGFMLSVRPGFPTPWPLRTAVTSCCRAGVRMGVATEGPVVEDDTLGNKKELCVPGRIKGMGSRSGSWSEGMKKKR